MISVDELNEEKFYQFFYERCGELFSRCKETEKELFYPKFNGDLKDITVSDISHENLTYTSFLTEILKKNTFLLDPRTRKDDRQPYGVLFKSHIKSKKLWIILKWMHMWNQLPKETKIGELEKILYKFQYMETKEKTGGKLTKAGLSMPVYGLPRYESIYRNGKNRCSIKNSLKKAQKRYETYEILRVLISFERMMEDKVNDEHFFHSYINRLANKFFEYQKNELNKDIKNKKVVLKKLLDVLNHCYFSTKKLDIIIKLLEDEMYEDARKQYEKDLNELNMNEREKKRIDAYFSNLQFSFPIQLEACEKSNEENIYKERVFQAEDSEEIIVNKTQYDNLLNVLKNNYYNVLIEKYVKYVSKNHNSLNEDILTKIKQASIKYFLQLDIIDNNPLDSIKNKLCDDFANYEPELIHMYIKKYPLVYRKMQEELEPFYNPKKKPDIKKMRFVKEKYKEIEDYYNKKKELPRFINDYKSELAYYILKDSYILKNKTHKNFKGVLIRNIMAFQKSIDKENNKDNEKYISNLTELIKIRIKQIKSSK